MKSAKVGKKKGRSRICPKQTASHNFGMPELRLPEKEGSRYPENQTRRGGKSAQKKKKDSLRVGDRQKLSN